MTSTSARDKDAAATADAAAAADAAGAAVPSPCINVCRMHARTGLCEGCLRTLDEIAAWSQMSEDDKRQVWAALRRRRAREQGLRRELGPGLEPGPEHGAAPIGMPR